jgi:hypothetical protein
MSWPLLFILALQQFVVPFIFAIGLIFLIYGIITYFIIGPGEEPTREAGRVYFIKAFVWFLVGLLLFVLVSGLLWMVDRVTQVANSVQDGEVLNGDGDGDRGFRSGLQNVPNTPRGND